jgi:hypothetical protein
MVRKPLEGRGGGGKVHHGSSFLPAYLGEKGASAQYAGLGGAVLAVLREENGKGREGRR